MLRGCTGEGPLGSAPVPQTAVKLLRGYADQTDMLHAIRIMTSDNLVNK